MENNNQIQKDDVLMPGGLGLVKVASTGAISEITERFDSKDGSTTLTLTPISKSVQKDADFIQKCIKEGSTPIIRKARRSGMNAAIQLAMNTEDAEFEVVQPKQPNQ